VTARALAASAAVALLAALSMIALAGFPARLSPQQQATADFIRYDHRAVYETGVCFLNPNQTFEDLQSACIAKGPHPRILLWGDSHAAHLVHGLKQALPKTTLMRASMAQCAPDIEAGQSAACTDFNRRLPGLVRDLAPDIVMISANWMSSAMTPTTQASLLATTKAITAAGGRTIVIGPGPQFDRPVPKILVASSRFGVASTGHEAYFLGEVDASLRDLLKDQPQTDYVSLLALLCPGKDCVLQTPEGAPLAWDEGHLTAQGSELAASLIVNASPALAAAAENAQERE